MLLAIEDHILEDITSAKSGDTEAFTRIITHARNTVTSIALAIVQDLDNSEEVAQQVFISVWENLNSLKNSASFYPWIRQMTRYKAYNFLRDNKIDRKITGEHAEDLLAKFCDPKASQIEQMERTQQSQILAQFINELPSESREIVLLYYREEESTKQVANLLELSEVNVRKKLSRIRKRLKGQLLEKYGKLILSTAPTIGLSSLIISSLTVSPPIAAATLMSTITSGKSGIFGKLMSLFSGILIGVAGGIIGVILGSRQSIQRISDKNAKKILRKYRNQAIAWVVVSGILFALSFKLTSGWIFPVATYALFAIGLIIRIKKMGHFAIKYIYPQELTATEQHKKIMEKIYQWIGIWGGVIAGFGGLIIGMISDGRIS